MLLQSISLALGLVGSLSLFLSLKREIQANARKHCKRLEEIERRLREAWETSPRQEPVMPPPRPRSGFNLSKRVHAMRMLRRGQDVAHIAAALGVPRREVELLIRVQEMTRAASS